MWLIRQIVCKLRGRPEFNLPCVRDLAVYERDRREKFEFIRLTLYNTETRISEFIEYNGYGWSTFWERLRNRNPYGFISDRYMLVAIDDVSFQFLKFVAGVTTNFDLPLHERSWLCNQTHDFLFIDSANTIVCCKVHQDSFRYPFTLFQAACFAEDFWKDDILYLGHESNNRLTAYLVMFSDVVSARRLLAKAMLLGYNSMQSVRSLFCSP